MARPRRVKPLTDALPDTEGILICPDCNTAIQLFRSSAGEIMRLDTKYAAVVYKSTSHAHCNCSDWNTKGVPYG